MEIDLPSIENGEDDEEDDLPEGVAGRALAAPGEPARGRPWGEQGSEMVSRCGPKT